MAALSVTPPSSLVTSSPMAIRSNGMKRISSSRGPARLGTSMSGSAVQAPTPSLTLASQGNGEDPFAKFTALSSSLRRATPHAYSAQGSPDTSFGARPSPSRGPLPAAIVGFELESQTSTSTVQHRPAGLPMGPGAKSARGQGLLSKALAGPPQALPTLHELPLASSLPSLQVDTTIFFPDVDSSPLKDLQAKYPVFSDPNVVTAYMLAASSHAGQTRKDGTPMMAHCTEVATILASLGLDASTVAAGLLHELHAGAAAEPSFQGRLEEFMPRPVMQLVERVNVINEISQLYRNNRDKFGDESLRRMMLAMEDVKAVLVKLADRVHNMRTISALPRDKQVLMAQETLDIYSVVANRLGVWCLKAELEDLAFAILHPEDYESLKAQVSARQDTAALEATICKIKAGLDEKGVAYEDISGRPKNLWGIYQKMKADGMTSLDKVYDVIALRVVLANKHDCYVARRVVQRMYACMPDRSKDFIREIRKPNGYQSLHETMEGEGGLTMEVQIRTHKMHYVAEYGFAAHWKYKEKLSDEDQWLDKEVQYKKWLTTYKLGVHDKKVRASGSPPTDHSLKSLGMAYLDGAKPEEEKMVDPFLKHDRFKLELQPTKPLIGVVVQTQNDIIQKEFAAGTTVSQITADLGVQNLPGYTLTVNGKVRPAQSALQCGDLVQVVPVRQALARSPGSLFRPGSLQEQIGAVVNALGNAASQQQRQPALMPA